MCESHLVALYIITKINPMGIPMSFANVLGYRINHPAKTTFQKFQYGVGGFGEFFWRRNFFAEIVFVVDFIMRYCKLFYGRRIFSGSCSYGAIFYGRRIF